MDPDWQIPPGGQQSVMRVFIICGYAEQITDNAYINGIDFDFRGNLLTSWTYRDYVNDTGQDVAVQAGPNGPENVRVLFFHTAASPKTASAEPRLELRLQHRPRRDLVKQLEPDDRKHEHAGAHRPCFGWYSHFRDPQIRVSTPAHSQ